MGSNNKMSAEEAFLHQYLESKDGYGEWTHSPFSTVDGELFSFMRAYLAWSRRGQREPLNLEAVREMEAILEDNPPTQQMRDAAAAYAWAVSEEGADVGFISADFQAGARWAIGKIIDSGLHGIPTHTKYADGTPVRVGDKCQYGNDTIFTVVFENYAMRKRYEGWGKSLLMPLLEGQNEADSYGGIRKVTPPQ
jgi:hypothetical protein